MARVERLPQAVDDLIAIWEYIAVENHSRDAADRLIRRFDELMRLLAQQPEMGVKQDRFSVGLRSFSFQNYLLFYRPIDDGIRLIRVLHGARDFKSLFE